MKFTSSLLSLFAVTSVYAYSLESDIVVRNYEVSFNDAVECENNNCGSNEVYIDHENAKACKESFESYYKECRFVEGTSKNDVDNMCKNFESEKCNEFYKKSINSLPGCETIASQLLKKYETLKEYNNNAFLIKCTKDENNEYCPLSKFTFYDRSSSGFKPTKINVKDKEFVDAINSSCYSKSCYETAIKVISMNKETAKLLTKETSENENESADVTNYCIGNIENLSTDNIEQNVRNSNSDDTSGTIMKINSHLLFNGLVLLITLYLLSF